MRAEQVRLGEADRPDAAVASHGGRVLMLPGRGYDCTMPVLHRTTLALQAAGWRVFQAHWELPHLPDQPATFVSAVARRLDDLAGPDRGDPVVVVGKSLGAAAAPWARERGLAAAWLTPVLTDTSVRAVLGSYPGANLVVGGTGDPLWVRGFRGSGTTLEVEGADHSLTVPDAAATERVHHRVAEAVVALAAEALRPA